MKTDLMDKIIPILRGEVAKLETPVVGVIAETTKDPFRILISCILSLRTRDQVTADASYRLFTIADTPKGIISSSRAQIEKAIYPVSFYRNKAKQIIALSRAILENHDGHVPKTLNQLLALPGVGRKTANLVITLAFGKPGICVDTHVHRISNRIGYIKTRTPEESEMALRKKLPKKYWIMYNDILVPYGQFICRPISPFCSQCKITTYCKKVSVTSSR